MKKIDKVFQELSALYEFYREIKSFEFKDKKKSNHSLSLTPREAAPSRHR